MATNEYIVSEGFFDYITKRILLGDMEYSDANYINFTKEMADYKDKNERNILYYFLVSGHRKQRGTIFEFIELGADIHNKDKMNMSLLHYLCAKRSFTDKHKDLNYSEMIKYFISEGLDVNLQDKFGRTSLIMACMYGNIQAIESYLEHGADIRIKNNNGQDCMDILQERVLHYTNKNELEKLFRTNNIVAYLSSRLQLVDKIDRHIEIIKDFNKNGIFQNAINLADFGEHKNLLAKIDDQRLRMISDNCSIIVGTISKEVNERYYNEMHDEVTKEMLENINGRKSSIYNYSINSNAKSFSIPTKYNDILHKVKNIEKIDENETLREKENFIICINKLKEILPMTDKQYDKIFNICKQQNKGLSEMQMKFTITQANEFISKNGLASEKTLFLLKGIIEQINEFYSKDNVLGISFNMPDFKDEDRVNECINKYLNYCKVNNIDISSITGYQAPKQEQYRGDQLFRGDTLIR